MVLNHQVNSQNKLKQKKVKIRQVLHTKNSKVINYKISTKKYSSLKQSQM